MPYARATVDFFAGQAAARRRTLLLLAWFGVALAAEIGLAYCALLLPALVPLGAPGGLFRPALLAAVAAVVLVTTGAGCWYHARALSRGGGAGLAERLGATPLDPGTAAPEERRLLNVVEEMAIAAALPVPRVYVLRAEPAINALAAGPSPGHAVVAVTAGALRHLSRAELQAVVAHEFSHVLHGDLRLHELLMGAVGGLGILDLAGRETLRLAWPARPGVRLLLLPTALVLAAAGALGALCGQLVRCAVSRQREFLADASAAQLTRDPAALARALLAIARHGSTLRTRRAVEASHFFFADALSGRFARWLSSHPPVAERVRRLDPALALAARLATAEAPEGEQGATAELVGEGAAAPACDRGAERRVPAAEPPAAPATLARAVEVLAALPPAVRAAALDPRGAAALVTCLALERDPARRAAQLAALPPPRRGELLALAVPADRMGADARLAAVDLALPALDLLGAAEGAALAADLDAVARADGHLSVFEWMLGHLVRRRLARMRSGRAAPPVRYRSVRALEPECLQLLSLVAWAGTRDAASAQAAVAEGLRSLGLDPRWRVLPRERLGVAAAEGALRALDLGSAEVKRRVLRACHAAVAADGRATAPEAELLRAISGSLGCPAPPLFPGPLSAAAAA